MMFAAWLGVLKAGGVVVATMPLLRPGEIATVIDRAEISPRHRRQPLHRRLPRRDGPDALRQAPDQIRRRLWPRRTRSERSPASTLLPPVDTAADDPALIAFTSGTTGVPKGCVHFHRDILAPCDTFAKTHYPMKPGDIVLTSAPIAFTFGLGATLLFPFRFGAAAATIEQATPPAMLDAIAKYGVTHLATAPTAYKAMLGQPDLDRALTTLTACVSAGEHLPLVDVARVEGPHRHHDRRRHRLDRDDAYLHHRQRRRHPPRQHRPGRPRLHRRDPRRRTAMNYREGEGRLAIRGPTGCRYLDDPRQADYVARWLEHHRRHLRRDADGYYWYLARSDDMIVSSGYNIGAPDVENALLAHPAVAECAVIGVPCPERGQKVKAFVVLADFAEPSDELADGLKAFVKDRIAPYKYPREIEFVDALPKTATGKFRRVELRNR